MASRLVHSSKFHPVDLEINIYGAVRTQILVSLSHDCLLKLRYRRLFVGSKWKCSSTISLLLMQDSTPSRKCLFPMSCLLFATDVDKASATPYSHNLVYSICVM